MNHIKSPQLAFDFGPNRTASNDSSYSSWPIEARSTRRYREAPSEMYRSPQWRRTAPIVLERDNYSCHFCSRGKPDALLQVHHLIPRSIAPHLFYSLSNLMTLCEECHRNETMKQAIKYGWSRMHA